MNSPSPLVIGGTISNGASPTVLVGILKSDRTVVNALTCKEAVIVADVYFDVLAWTAVMVEMPPPIMVMVLPSIVATDVFELV